MMAVLLPVLKQYYPPAAIDRSFRADATIHARRTVCMHALTAKAST